MPPRPKAREHPSLNPPDRVYVKLDVTVQPGGEQVEKRGVMSSAEADVLLGTVRGETRRFPSGK
jgi:hypothetical protein